MQNTILQEQQSCSVQKTARKNTKYWKKKTILKIGHLAKAIALAEWSVWVKNYKCQKHAKTFNKYSSVVLCKKRLEKAPNIGKMRHF